MAHGDIFGCKYFQRGEQLGDGALLGSERLRGSLESGPDGFLPSCTAILRRL